MGEEPKKRKSGSVQEKKSNKKAKVEKKTSRETEKTETVTKESTQKGGKTANIKKDKKNKNAKRNVKKVKRRLQIEIPFKKLNEEYHSDSDDTTGPGAQQVNSNDNSNIDNDVKDEAVVEKPENKEDSVTDTDAAPAAVHQFGDELSVLENSSVSNEVIAVFKQDMEFYGSVVLTLLSGRIAINGYKMAPMEARTIFSPKGFNWIVVSPLVNHKKPKLNLWRPSFEKNFSSVQLDNIGRNYSWESDAIVLLQPNTKCSAMMTTFGKHMAENVFPRVNATNRPHYASEYLVNCLLQSSYGTSVLQVPRQWMKLQLSPNCRMVVAGGKGVGKSSLVRHLINRHLTPANQRVLLIDLDIGQPEMFIPQTVSCFVVEEPLLGPGFFYNKQPNMAYAVGHTNVVMCAEQYARAVKTLISDCSAYADLPWIINTMGYNKGFGLELMALIVNWLRATDLVEITSLKAINNFDKPLSCETLQQIQPMVFVSRELAKDDGFQAEYVHHVIPSCAPEKCGSVASATGWMMSAKERRFANTLARISCATNGTEGIDANRCCTADLKDLRILYYMPGAYTREELIAGLEGNLALLCIHTTDKKPPRCLGMGIVRDILYKQQQACVVPAMPLEKLKDVNCLMIGADNSLPQSFFKNQGSSVRTLKVPFVFMVDDGNASKSIQQIYHRPAGFLGDPTDKSKP